MRYVFFGTPRIARIILERLIELGLPPVALVCNPDRPAGRKKIITPPATKEFLLEKKSDIGIFQPESLDEATEKRLRAYDADFFLVAAYAHILPPGILTIPKQGTLGIHPSLLPQYRGPSPILSVLLAREKSTGTTIYCMDEKMDHGPLIAQESLPIHGTEKYAELEERLARLSAELAAKTIPSFLEGKITPTPQDENRATFTKKFSTGDAFIAEADLKAAISGKDPARAELILGKINAFASEPGAWTIENGKRIKILDARIENGALILKTIQKEGGKPQPASGHSQ